METLTERQSAIMAYIQEHIRHNSAPPTFRDIARHFGFKSPKAAQDHVVALERKGYVERTPGIARSLRVLVDEHDSERGDPGSIPIVGDVAAGLPILAIENALGTLSMDSAFGSGDLFAVRVRGDSMVDYGIFEGDFVVVRRSSTVEQDAIAVVYVDGEATVKKLRKTSSGYTLIPGNQRYAPVHLTPDMPDVSVAGPVVGVVRSMA